jgi:hypothetical protein
MKQLNNFELTSLAGALTSVSASLTLERLGIIAGLVTALVTCVANVIYMTRKDRREQRESDARIAAGTEPGART